MIINNNKSSNNEQMPPMVRTITIALHRIMQYLLSLPKILRLPFSKPKWNTAWPIIRLTDFSVIIPCYLFFLRPPSRAIHWIAQHLSPICKRTTSFAAVRSTSPPFPSSTRTRTRTVSAAETIHHIPRNAKWFLPHSEQSRCRRSALVSYQSNGDICRSLKYKNEICENCSIIPYI